MPIRYSDYSPEWKSVIRPAILARANNCCEQCGVANYEIGYRDCNGKFIPFQQVEDALNLQGVDYFSKDHCLEHWHDSQGIIKQPIKIVLTIAHLDHNTANNDYTNLMALCQYDHLKMDCDRHKANARNTLNNRKGLQNLF